MSLKLRALARLLPIFFVMGALFSSIATGCGRSDLLSDSLTIDGGKKDGGPGSCGPASCPGGCCDSNGTCRVGTDAQACGELGSTCSDCLGLGFTSCDDKTHACSKITPNCDSTNCTFGCCVTDPSGTQFCVGGTDAMECGASGASCADCTQFGDICEANTRTCVPSKCNAQTCADGCCVGNLCQHGGKSDTACGNGGIACDDCAVRGQTCGTGSDGGASFVCVGAAACGPKNCKGCCIGDVCVTGGDDTACGLAGTQCANCAGKGQACSAGGTCQASTCSPANCAGCCQGNACVLMTSDAACGKGGAACKPCGVNTTCNAGTCVATPPCGPATCPTGCCQAGVCATGTQSTICGNSGAACQNCSAAGLTCTGQACVKPVCSPANCAGCCSNGACVAGSQDTICGNGGGACTDCTGGGQVCGAGGLCKDPCGPKNCAAGCCNGQACVGGFLNNRCGSGGAACADCAAGGATCDTAAVPRVCTKPNTCPQKYAACGAGVSTPKLSTHQNACATSDLQDAAAACSGGLAGGNCQAFFAFLTANAPACASCLTPFEHDYNASDYAAIFNCASPFVNNACNHSTGCETDCESSSCAMCAPGDVVACENNVQGNGGQCQKFQAASSCINMALGNPPGDACDPFDPRYNFGDYGLFLQGMGKLFCQP